jgi:curved DNA-binding protein CbpA
VSPTSDDYYELIGVEPGAPTNEIRERYRARRDELNARDTDDARAESAQLNRAWNVLSDPYQRGRYDAQRETASGNGVSDDIEVLDDEDATPAPAPRRGRRRLDAGPARPARANAPSQRPPTITLPAGQQFADTRPRLLAMAIDLIVLIVLFFSCVYYIGGRIIDHRFPGVSDELSVLRDQRDAAQKVESNLADALKAANAKVSSLKKQNASASDIEAAQAAARAAKAKDAAQQKHVKNIEDHYNRVQRKVLPTSTLVLEGTLLIGLLYLAVPSALTGQTLGKRSQHVRAQRANGSRLGWGGAFARYGVVVVATNLLSFPLQQLAPVLVIVGVVGWMRNPNRQGLHDRLAKTVVVTA